MNAVVFLVIVSAWNLPAGRLSSIVPFLVILTSALLVGPLAGLISKPVRKVILGS